jgi:hypothetical protein
MRTDQLKGSQSSCWPKQEALFHTGGGEVLSVPATVLCNLTLVVCMLHLVIYLNGWRGWARPKGKREGCPDQLPTCGRRYQGAVHAKICSDCRCCFDNAISQPGFGEESAAPPGTNDQSGCADRQSCPAIRLAGGRLRRDEQNDAKYLLQRRPVNLSWG